MTPGKGKTINVDYDAVESLSSVIKQRATGLDNMSTYISGLMTLSNSDVAAGQDFVQKVWSTVVGTLGGDLTLTSTKTGKAGNVYEKNDKTVAIQEQKTQ